MPVALGRTSKIRIEAAAHSPSTLVRLRRSWRNGSVEKYGSGGVFFGIGRPYMA